MSIAPKCTCGKSSSGFCISRIKECKQFITVEIMGNKYPIGIDPQEIWDEFSEYVDDDSDSFSRYAGRDVMLFDNFVRALTKIQEVPTGAVWVKASKRLPLKEHNYFVKAITKFQGYNHNDTALWRNGKWEFDRENGRTVVEWLDENPSPTPSKESDAVEFNSEWLAGRSKERFKELEYKGHDWRSFYIGWIEGRADAIADLIKKKKEQKEVKP